MIAFRDDYNSSSVARVTYNYVPTLYSDLYIQISHKNIHTWQYLYCTYTFPKNNNNSFYNIFVCLYTCRNRLHICLYHEQISMLCIFKWTNIYMHLHKTIKLTFFCFVFVPILMYLNYKN